MARTLGECIKRWIVSFKETEKELSSTDDPADSLVQALRFHIEEQEQIRDRIDKNIEAARSLEDDILAVVNDMTRRRDEA